MITDKEHNAIVRELEKIDNIMIIVCKEKKVSREELKSLEVRKMIMDLALSIYNKNII